MIYQASLTYGSFSRAITVQNEKHGWPRWRDHLARSDIVRISLFEPPSRETHFVCHDAVTSTCFAKEWQFHQVADNH
jgi:hypothetical protein